MRRPSGPSPRQRKGGARSSPGPTLPRLQGLCRSRLCFLLFELQFIQHTVPPFKLCNRVTSSIFGVVQPSPVNFRPFSSPQKEALCTAVISPCSPPGPRQPGICSLSLRICPLWTFHRAGTLRCLASFSHSNIFEVHPCHSLTTGHVGIKTG